jgi:hypothetical protein
MKSQTPFQWIEEAEARTVLTTAMFEQAAEPSRWRRAQQETSRLLYRLRVWCAAEHQVSSPRLQVQPALVRRPAHRCDDRRGDLDGYSCRW